MLDKRLEVRLDRERRRKLVEVAEQRGLTISELVREMIDRAYEESLKAGRLRAAEELGRLEVEEVPEPEELSRQLEGTYDLK